MRPIEIPEAVRLRATAAGTPGLQWLASLRTLADGLAARWNLSLGDVLTGGTEAVVLDVRMADERRAILKLNPPGAETAQAELRTLLAAQGRGYVEVYRHDADVGALLLERLGGQLIESGWPLPNQLAALCATLKQAWTVPPPDGLMSGAEKARALADFIEAAWAELGRPCSAAVIETALRYAEERRSAFDPDLAVLAHGDAHAWNALQAFDGSYKFVDPDGLFVEPAYDLGISMREWSAELLAGDPAALGRERAALLASLTGVPPEPIWQWGFMERVSTGLLCLRLGLDGGAEMLGVAEAWTR